MTRLQTEFDRLYGAPADAPGDGVTPGLIDGHGRTRALVLEWVDPSGWEALAPLWRGVQVDLDLPAPAIAVSGTDALQLWFSLAEALDVAQAHAFLDALRRRYLPDIALKRLRLLPTLGATGGDAHPGRHARPVPAPVPATGNWSAFIAPDLAPLFAETPWLDLPPGDEGQASLLSRLGSITPTALAAARLQLQPPSESAAAPSAPRASATAPPGATGAGFDEPNDEPRTLALGSVPGGFEDPRDFLRAVMNDATAPLVLRLDAAKALLPFPAVDGPR